MAASTNLILGRDRELHEVERFLESIPVGPSALVLEGIAGIGKTTLWQAGVNLARDRGGRVLSSRAAESEARLSYTALGDLLEDDFDEALSDLPAPQREALETALLRATTRAPPDQRAVSVASLGALRTLAGSGPLIVAIDDVQWLDAPSARVLSFALRRLRDERIGVLASLRLGSGSKGDPLGIDQAFPARQLRRLAVGPLSDDELGRLLRERTGTHLTRPVILRLHRVSRGNPLFALEMARAVGREGARIVPGEPLPVSEDLQQLLRARLAALPRSAGPALLAVAAASRPTEDLVLGAAGWRERALDGLASAEKAGVLERAGDRIRFSHPLLGSTVYAGAPPGERRSLHVRLAALVADPEEQARHLALASAGPDPTVATALDEAARHSRARGAPDAAAELAELARQLTPQDDVDAHRRRSLETAEYHFDAGDAGRAIAVLEEAIESSQPGRGRAEILYRLASMSWMNLERGVRAPLERALPEAGDDPELLAGIHVDLAWVDIYEGHLADALAHAERSVSFVAEVSDPATRADALSTLSMVQFLMGGSAEDALSEALKLQDIGMSKGSWTETSVYTTPRTTLGLQLTWAGELGSAREALLHELAEYERLAMYTVRQEVLCFLSEVECRAARWQIASRYSAEAMETVIESGQTATQSHVVLYNKALAAAHLGDTDVARRDAAQGVQIALSNDDPFYGSWNRAVLGFLELSLSNFEEAHENLEPAVTFLRSMGAAEPGIIPCIPDDIEALISLGRIDEAVPLLEELEEQARRLDRPWARATSLRCRALVTAAGGDLTSARALLEESLVEHRRVPQPFELARTLMVRGEVERRSKQKRAAASFLHQALEIFDDLGAPLWSAKARNELGRVGGTAATPTELTPTEQRVADLIAEGRSNREVANALFVSVKTIEANLTRIFRKLGIRTRAELIRRAAADPSSPGGASDPTREPT